MFHMAEKKMQKVSCKDACMSCDHAEGDPAKGYYCSADEKRLEVINNDLCCDSFLERTIKRTDGTADNVNHPAHYETGRFECFDVMIETQGADAVKDFCVCNAFKYLYRFRKKNGDEDIKKANWYLNKYLELCEKE